MRGHIFKPETRDEIRLIQSVNLFKFPSGVQDVAQARGAWALGAITNFDMRYRTGSCRGKWIQRPRNSIHLYAPACRYQTDNPVHNGELHSAWLTFSAGEDSPLLKIVDKNHFAQIVDPQHRIISLVNQCADICERRKEDGYYAAQGVLHRIVDLLVSSKLNEDGTRRVSSAKPRQRKESFSLQVKAYLQEHMHELIRLEDIAQHCHVSVSTLSHRYREICGESPMHTHNNMRMDHAQQLLLLGESVSNIADQLGYSDVYHFSKAFKKHEGVSPTAFLKKYS